MRWISGSFLMIYSDTHIWLSSPNMAYWTYTVGFSALFSCTKIRSKRLAKRLIWCRLCKTLYWIHVWRQINYSTKPGRIDSVGHEYHYFPYVELLQIMIFLWSVNSLISRDTSTHFLSKMGLHLFFIMLSSVTMKLSMKIPVFQKSENTVN